ncbi:PP2C family protein-serine/threonine phosphatase [Phocaeicola plebeius]
MKMIELNTFSHSGKDKANEDYALCHRLSDNSLVAVLADGMGGLSYGAEAAKIVSESIMAAIRDNVQECSPEEILRMAFDAADVAIYRKCRELKCRMGAAVTVALVMDASLYYAWQGNVRLYKVSDGELSLLTTDHIVADAEGTYLTRCVNGKGFRENIPVMHEELEQVDRIIICSDGCYRHTDLNAMINHGGAFEFDGIFEDDASLIEMKKSN